MAITKQSIPSTFWKTAPSSFMVLSTLCLTFILLFFFLILPVGVIMKNAFIDQTGHFTLDYFQLLFSNHLYQKSIINSINISIATTFFATLLSLPLALLNNRYNYRFKSLLSGLLLVPMIMPPFVGAIGIQRFFARFGTVNQLLLNYQLIDTPIDWLGGTSVFWAVVLLEVLHLYPILYLNISAALANIDPSLDDMAKIVGSSWLKRCSSILWPLAKPGFLAGAMIVFIWSLTDLGTPLLFGYHDTMPVRIFNMITDINENPVGFALVFVVIVLTVVCFTVSKLFFKADKYQMLGRGHSTPSMSEASLKLYPLIYFCMIGTVLLALMPHITVLIVSISDQWFMTPFPESLSLKHYIQVFQQDLPAIGIKNSIVLSIAATALDIFLGLMIAYIIARKLIPMTSILDTIVMIPLALPGVVLAFGYVITYSGTSLDPLLNPVPLLIIAYAIRRLPYMVRSASAGLQQTSKSLEEASQSLGATRAYTIRKITIPLVSANLIAGSLLCFSYAMLDVSDSMILAVKDQFYPMTKAIYSLYLEQGNGEYVASALGVISMLILSTCILGSSVLLGKKMGELFRA